MRADDLVLGLQRVVDRLLRPFLATPGAIEGRRRFLIVQIDGLSRDVLERALAEGYLPFMRRLLVRGRWRVEPMAVGLPTSTPAFQMAMMYGIHPDIPGFHFYDKRQRADVHFPRAGHAARVETEQASGRTGILAGGSAYGCCFTGGAANNLFSFARFKRPTGEGLLRVATSLVVLVWVTIKCLVLSAVMIVRHSLRSVAYPVREQGLGWQWLAVRLGISVWVRELFTLAVARDLYRGTPAVYVNYLDYDVFAHGFGPGHWRALRALRRVDRAIRRLARVLRRVPELRYDLYILSDHGQALCRPFTKLAGGRPFERVFFEDVLPLPDPTPSAPPARARRRWRTRIRGFRKGEPGTLQRFLNYLEEDFFGMPDEAKETVERDGLRVVSAGPNAFVYLIDEPEPVDMDAIEERYPGLAENLSRCSGVGHVLARSTDGPVCWWRGKRYRLELGEAGPFAGRADLDLVLEAIRELMEMRSAGDLVVYGTDAPGGHVSFIPELGAHAGASPEELHTFIIHPTDRTLPTPITHPVRLYGYFMGYQETA
jgi:Type I phosphodiesterase / nucleotide pyrophosphatase